MKSLIFQKISKYCYISLMISNLCKFCKKIRNLPINSGICVEINRRKKDFWSVLGIGEIFDAEIELNRSKSSFHLFTPYIFTLTWLNETVFCTIQTSITFKSFFITSCFNTQIELPCDHRLCIRMHRSDKNLLRITSNHSN